MPAVPISNTIEVLEGILEDIEERAMDNRDPKWDVADAHSNGWLVPEGEGVILRYDKKEWLVTMKEVQ